MAEDGRLRYVQPDGTPISWVVVYLASAHKELAENASEIRGPLFMQIEQRLRLQISEVAQTIRTGSLPKGAAPALGIAPYDAGFGDGAVLHHHYRKPVEVSFSYYPAETLTGVMRPTSCGPQRPPRSAASRPTRTSRAARCY